LSIQNLVKISGNQVFNVFGARLSTITPRQQTMRANHAVFDPIFTQYIIENKEEVSFCRWTIFKWKTQDFWLNPLAQPLTNIGWPMSQRVAYRSVVPIAYYPPAHPPERAIGLAV
jgi:hypothetical protein